MRDAPEIELLWWSGCPSTEEAIELVGAEMTRLGLDPGALRVREVRDHSEAERERFPGSPTIRVEGRDVVEAGAGHGGLTCRVYRLRDGRVSALPDRADVAAALESALEGEEGIE